MKQNRRIFLKRTGAAAIILGTGSFSLAACSGEKKDPLDRKIKVHTLGSQEIFEPYRAVFEALKDSGLRIQIKESDLEGTLDKKPDLALVLSPAQTRGTVISMLLEKDIPVMTNLPVGASFLEYDLIQEVLNEKNLRISCLNPLRYLDDFIDLRKSLQKEQQDITRIKVWITPGAGLFPWDKEPQGYLGNIGYVNDLFRWLFARATSQVEVLQDRVSPGALFARTRYDDLTVTYHVPEDPESFSLLMEHPEGDLRFGPWYAVKDLQEDPDPWLLPMHRNLSDALIAVLYGLEPETGMLAGMGAVSLNHHAKRSVESGRAEDMIIKSHGG